MSEISKENSSEEEKVTPEVKEEAKPVAEVKPAAEATPVAEAKPEVKEEVKPAAKAEAKPAPKKVPFTKPEPKTSSEKRVGEIFVGRRKVAIARIKLVKGSGVITVNKKPLEEFFKKPADVRKVRQPLELTGLIKEYDVKVNVQGGGNTGQAEATRMSIARALDIASPEHHKQLRDAGFLTRDSRMVERKKYGLHKARRASQFSKR